MVQAEGLEAVFECLYTGAVAYTWFVNGIEGSSSRFPPEIKETGGTSGNPSVLTIPVTSQFNNSVVQCGALSFNGGVLSRNATLTIGEFYCLLSLKLSHFFFISEQVAIEEENGESSIIITVTNDFTTNLTYRLDVTQTNQDSNECTCCDLPTFSTEKQMKFNCTNRSVCDIFSFTVIPTAMEMEGRPSEPVTGFFTTVTGTVSVCFSECLST